ncbi:MAG TPA: DNA glycosylase [Methanomassiliicoccales archaeon]|nr:DNA glycosylase [Methanomassiliicoccales archaeon]
MDLGPIDLDYTLDCGQAFRWRKSGNEWRGIVGGKTISLYQKGNKIEASTDLPNREVERYFRTDDDLRTIESELRRDEYVASLVDRFKGLRLLRQEHWECACSYVLATNANVPRIKKMIETVCATYGNEIEEGVFGFPSPRQVLSKEKEAQDCRLGYRCDRFVAFARAAASRELDFDSLRALNYEDCVRALVRFDGVGDKVADCIAVFCLDHLEAFPIDVRIKRVLMERYSMAGSYRKLSAQARAHFGRFGGYAQEYIYFAEDARNR